MEKWWELSQYSDYSKTHNSDDYKESNKPEFKGFESTQFFNLGTYNVDKIGDEDVGGYHFPSKSSIYYGVTDRGYTKIKTMGRLIEGSAEGYIYEGALGVMMAEGFGRQINYDQNWYQGYFKNGLFDGKGTYWDNKLGPISGFWTKGKMTFPIA